MSRSRDRRKKTLAEAHELVDATRVQADRRLRERALEILCRSCPECRAGWGLACRSAGGALAPFHRSRLASSGPSRLHGVVNAPPAGEWAEAVAKAKTRAANEARVRQLGEQSLEGRVPSFGGRAV